MRSAIVSVSTSVVGGIITYLVLQLSTDMPPAGQWSVVAGGAGIALLSTLLALRRRGPHENRVGLGDVYVNIYVDNLHYGITSQDLEELFANYGEVVSAQVIKDRGTGRTRGFGFVKMANEGEARTAIEALNGREIQGRRLNVNEARPRRP